MLIGGLQKLTLIDYPGKIACTVFTVGCNFRCPFCHNPELVDRDKFNLSGIVEEKNFFAFLETRRGLLDGVCVTGGEPTLYGDLPQFIQKIRGFGFSVKLDTNGTNPGMLKSLISGKIIDYIAMDIKTEIGSYEEVVGVKVSPGDIAESIKIIMASGLDYEFRTTVVPGLHTKENILNLAESIRGAKKYYLQQFRPGTKILGDNCRAVKPYPAEFLAEIKNEIRGLFEVCEVRE